MIHQLDPAVRILAGSVLSISAALCEHIYLAICYFVIAVLFIGIARLNTGRVISRLKPVFFLLIMLWILLPLTFDKSELIFLWTVPLSKAGVRMSALISIKSVTICLLFMSLVSTMTIGALGNGLHRVKVPDKMVFLMLMTYRYITVIENEYSRLIRAARLRGFKSRTDLHSYKTYAYLAGMLFVRASIRAKRVYQAMLCRGFNQKFHTLEIHTPSIKNTIFLALSVVIALLLIIIEHTGMVK